MVEVEPVHAERQRLVVVLGHGAPELRQKEDAVDFVPVELRGANGMTGHVEDSRGEVA
jgi:hypothetical protein